MEKNVNLKGNLFKNLSQVVYPVSGPETAVFYWLFHLCILST